ncbi:epoxide hydrolase [Calocera viscosa TUFC12733]|uniref:Epoxide hydrolase n=1 Tax=Calocera viscosa (strain TUFC12733) TaxID=1330018 RepID=A0A167LRP1_CALVF|nr:epoxide hydrolase [Calocera viscosa TUFC12733]
MSVPKPITVADLPGLSQEKADRMLRLLRDARLPEQGVLPSAGWEYGITLPYLQSLKSFWEEDWSYASLLAKLEQYNHYTVEIEDVDVHFIHVRSSKEGAIPLLLSHGWPGSVLEFQKVIKPLSEPHEPGVPAFHLVIPSLPGYIFSGPMPKKGWNLLCTARVFNTLMTEVLGYEEYVAQGGDWSFDVLRGLSVNHGQNCKLAHFNNFTAHPSTLEGLVKKAFSYLPFGLDSYAKSWIYSQDELVRMKHSEKFYRDGWAYSFMMATKPATIGYALYDSPLGTLSWVGEKYHGWVDNNHPLPLEEVVDTVALYYLTGTIHTSAMTYYENRHGTGEWLPMQKYGKTAISVFRWDMLYTPERWAKRIANVVFYKFHPEGGHFAALEQPEALVEDIRESVAMHWDA